MNVCRHRRTRAEYTVFVKEPRMEDAQSGINGKCSRSCDTDAVHDSRRFTCARRLPLSPSCKWAPDSDRVLPDTMCPVERPASRIRCWNRCVLRRSLRCGLPPDPVGAALQSAQDGEGLELLRRAVASCEEAAGRWTLVPWDAGVQTSDLCLRWQGRQSLVAYLLILHRR